MDNEEETDAAERGIADPDMIGAYDGCIQPEDVPTGDTTEDKKYARSRPILM